MKVVQVVKKLNNTELGKGGTHDTYVLVPSELDITDVFVKLDEMVMFTDKDTRETLEIRSTYGREKRIVGLGQYYRNHDLSAGDEIVFERRVSGKKIEHFICVRKNEDALVIQRYKKAFEILTPNRLGRFENVTTESGESLQVKFLTSEKKRNDSPEATRFYDVIVSGKSILNAPKAKGLSEIRVRGGKIEVTPFYGWKKYVFETEESE